MKIAAPHAGMLVPMVVEQTARGERARFFGGGATLGLLGRRHGNLVNLPLAGGSGSGWVLGMGSGVDLKKVKRIEVMVKPTACRARSALSRPEPGPLISTSRVRTPCSAAFLPASSAAT